MENNVEMMEQLVNVDADLDTGNEVTIHDLSEDCCVEDSHGKKVLGKALIVGGATAMVIIGKKVVVPVVNKGYRWAKTKIENIKNRKKSEEEVIDVEVVEE